MDWYFGGTIDDFVTPRDQELYDGLPSPQSWSNWDITAPESIALQSKCFLNDAKLAQVEFNDNGEMLSAEVEMASSAYDKDHSSGSSVGGLSWESLHETSLSHNQPDYQLDGHAGVNQMDDIFLSSLLEDLSGIENFDKLIPFASESQSALKPADNLFSHLTSDSSSISSDTHSMGSSKCVEENVFSPSVGWGKSEVAASQFIPCNSGSDDCPKVKAPFIKISDSHEDNSSEELVDEETSLEESVLLELEMVMTQLRDETRICFRDALYRLAKNSRQHMVAPNQNGDISMGDPPWTGGDQVSSVGKKTCELETNAIDRVIANMMFNKMDLDVQDFPVLASVSANQQVVGENDPPNDLQIHRLPCYPISRGDAEFLRLRQGCAQIRANPDELISRNPGENMMY